MSGRKLIDADELMEEMRWFEGEFKKKHPQKVFKPEQVTYLLGRVIDRILFRERVRDTFIN